VSNYGEADAAKRPIRIAGAAGGIGTSGGDKVCGVPMGGARGDGVETGTGAGGGDARSKVTVGAGELGKLFVGSVAGWPAVN